MTSKKSKSRKDSMKALTTMSENMTAMMSGASPTDETLPGNVERSETGDVETTQPSDPANPPVTDSTTEESSAVIQNTEYLKQSPESAEGNGAGESDTSIKQQGGPEMAPHIPVEVNIDIEKTQGNAIYSSLLGLQNTLDNFQLDVKQDSLREVVFAAFKEAVENYLTEEDKKQQAEDEKRRAEGKPATAFEAYQMATKRNTDAINKFNHNSEVIKKQYKNISDRLCEILGRVNLCPYEKPKFKDDSGNILLNSLYLYPWYCFKCFYSSKHVRWFFKTVAWSVWLISLGLLFFIARDNAILQKQQNINRYVHAYYSDNTEVTMELEGIDMMFSNLEVKPMSVNDYREYMKERKKEAKAKGSKQK